MGGQEKQQIKAMFGVVDQVVLEKLRATVDQVLQTAVWEMLSRCRQHCAHRLGDGWKQRHGREEDALIVCNAVVALEVCSRDRMGYRSWKGNLVAVLHSWVDTTEKGVEEVLGTGEIT